jgi:hypothetical protein
VAFNIVKSDMAGNIKVWSSTSWTSTHLLIQAKRGSRNKIYADGNIFAIENKRSSIGCSRRVSHGSGAGG